MELRISDAITINWYTAHRARTLTVAAVDSIPAFATRTCDRTGDPPDEHAG